MSLNSIVGAVVVVAVVVLLGLLAWTILHRQASPAQQVMRPEGLLPVADVRLEKGERQASMAMEQIEEVAQRKLAAYPDLVGKCFDFGTAPDGGLEIWFDEVRYEAVDQIPDARVRAAVAEAVNSFNQ